MSNCSPYSLALLACITVALPGCASSCSRVVSDETTLPEGPIAMPALSADDSRSKFRATLRIGIDTLSQLIKKESLHIKDGDQRGTINITKLALSAKDDSRIKVDKGRAVFEGKYTVKSFPIHKAEVDLAGTVLRPQVDSKWVCHSNPKVEATVTNLDVKSIVPDEVLRFAANYMFNGSLCDSIEKNGSIDLKDFVQSAWNQLSGDSDVSRWIGPLDGVLSLCPAEAFIVQPIIEGRTKSMRIGVGVNFSSVLHLGAGQPTHASTYADLPKLEELPPADRFDTQLRLPIVIRVRDLAALWQPSADPFPVPGGTFQIERVEFTEQDGVLHGRMRYAFRRDGGGATVAPRSVNGFVRFQARPTCDPRLGLVGLSDFSFTEKSDSLLVDMIGKQANSLIRTAFEKAVPAASVVLLLQAETFARENIDGILSHAITQLADDVTGLEDEIRRIKPSVSGLEFKPTDLRVESGHLILIVQADANILIPLSNSQAAL